MLRAPVGTRRLPNTEELRGSRLPPVKLFHFASEQLAPLSLYIVFFRPEDFQHLRGFLAVTASGIKLTKQEVSVLPLRIEFACFLQKRHSAVVFFAVVVDFSQTKAGRRVLRVHLKRFLKQQFG